MGSRRSVAVALLAFACSRPPQTVHGYRELDQPQQPAPRMTESIDASEVSADLELLVHALERG